METHYTFGGESSIDEILDEILIPAALDLRKDDIIYLYDSRLNKFFDDGGGNQGHDQTPPLKVDSITYIFDGDNKLIGKRIDLDEV